MPLKNKIVIVLNCIIGFLFLFSGVAKCIDVFGFQQLIVQYGFAQLHWIAPLIVIAEVVVGLLLLMQSKSKVVVWCSCFMIIVFTAAYTYANRVNGVVDCGCFGRFNFFTQSPIWVYARNGFILSALLFLWYWSCDARSSEPICRWKKILLFTILFPAVFISGMTYRPFAFSVIEHEYKNKTLIATGLKRFVSNPEGKSWVSFIGPNCYHCWNSIENIKSYRDSKFFDEVDLYMLIEDTAKINMDSLRIAFAENFGDVKFNTVLKSDASFVNVVPTSFYIEHDSIIDVLEHEVPSLLTLKRFYFDN